MITNDAVASSLNLARSYIQKPGNEVGGNLHIVLDDGNIDSDSICHCRLEAAKSGDTDGVRLANELLKLTPRERLIVYRCLG